MHSDQWTSYYTVSIPYISFPFISPTVKTNQAESIEDCIFNNIHVYTMSYEYNAILIQNKLLIVVEKYQSITDSYRQVYKYVPNYVYAQ